MASAASSASDGEKSSTSNNAGWAVFAFVAFAIAVAAFFLALFYIPPSSSSKGTGTSGEQVVAYEVSSAKVKVHELEGMSDILVNDSLDLQQTSSVIGAKVVRTASLAAADPSSSSTKIEIQDDLDFVSGAQVSGLSGLQVTGAISGDTVTAASMLVAQDGTFAGSLTADNILTTGGIVAGGNFSAANFSPTISFVSSASSTSGAMRQIVASGVTAANVLDDGLSRPAQPSEVVLTNSGELQVVPSRGVVALTGLSALRGLGVASSDGVANVYHAETATGTIRVRSVYPSASSIPADVTLITAGALSPSASLSVLPVWRTAWADAPTNYIATVDVSGYPRVFYHDPDGNCAEMSGLPNTGTVNATSIALGQSKPGGPLLASFSNNGQVELYIAYPSLSTAAANHWTLSSLSNLPATTGSSRPLMFLNKPAVICRALSPNMLLLCYTDNAGSDKSIVFATPAGYTALSVSPVAVAALDTNRVAVLVGASEDVNVTLQLSTTIADNGTQLSETHETLDVAAYTFGPVFGARDVGYWYAQDHSAPNLVMAEAERGAPTLEIVASGIAISPPPLPVMTPTTAVVAGDVLFWLNTQTSELLFGKKGCPATEQFLPVKYSGIYFT